MILTLITILFSSVYFEDFKADASLFAADSVFFPNLSDGVVHDYHHDAILKTNPSIQLQIALSSARNDNVNRSRIEHLASAISLVSFGFVGLLFSSYIFMASKTFKNQGTIIKYIHNQDGKKPAVIIG